LVFLIVLISNNSNSVLPNIILHTLLKTIKRLGYFFSDGSQKQLLLVLPGLCQTGLGLSRLGLCLIEIIDLQKLIF